MPYSIGPRGCIGQNLADITIRAFAAMLCARFRIELAPEVGPPLACPAILV